MSYTDPTAADLKARFPRFDAVADATLTVYLTEAQGWVSDEWVNQADYTQGQLLYAAHLLTLEGLGSGTEAELASQGLLGFKSITSGKLSVSRDTGASSGSGESGTLMQTQYGKRFKELQDRNVVTFYSC
jgi:hypothetical protein